MLDTFIFLLWETDIAEMVVVEIGGLIRRRVKIEDK